MKTIKHVMLFVLMLIYPCLAFADDIPFRVQRREIFRVMPITSEDIVFLGNSITNFGMWDEFFGSNGRVVNRGISGNISGEVLEHIDLIVAGKPKKLFLMIGINDFQDESVIIPNTRRIIEVFQKESPATEIYIQSLLPCNRADRHSMVEPVNEDLKVLCKEMNVTYIDVYSKIVKAGTPPGIAAQYTNDDLHVVAAGYREWINDYEKYVGYAPCLADGNNVFASGLVAFENIMISQFNMLPVNDGDILMVGDYNVQTGEWAELMQSGKVKNRGIGIGYGYSFTAAKLNNAVQHIVKGKPAKIFVQCGARDMAGSANVESTFAQYASAIQKMRNIAPDAEIYLQTLIPVTDGNINSNYFVPFNNKIKDLAASDTSGKIHVVDVYAALTENGVLNPKFVGANTAQSRGINGRGYLRWANTLAPYMGDGINALPELTDEQYELNELVSEVRRIVYTTQVDNTPGSYSADAIATLRSAMESAASVLSNADATTEQITEQIALLQKAMADVATQAVLPQFSTSDNEYYYTLSTPRRNNLYLTNEGNAMGRAKSTTEVQQWKFVKRSDDAVNIVSRSDGSFLSPVANANEQLKTVAAEPAKGWYLVPAGSQKLFIVVNESVQLHQTNASMQNKIINWGGGANSTDDGCLFLIEEAEEPEVVQIPDALLTLTNIELDGTAPYRIADDIAQPVLDAECVTIAVDATLSHNRSEQVLVGSSNSNAAESFVCLSVATATNYGVRYNNGGGKYTVNAQVGTNRHRFVITMQPQSPSVALYIDGSKSRDVAAVVPTLGNIAGVNGLYLGGLVCSDNSNKYPMTGTVHSVQFFPGVLSSEQIASIDYTNCVPTGIATIEEGNDMFTISDGVIKANTDDFKLYDIYGRALPKDNKLPAGIYIIELNGKSYKINL